MHNSSSRGNNPELWSRLLEVLDDKLQLGLLDHLKRVLSYHFEVDQLIVCVNEGSDAQYLTKSAVFQQLTLFAQDATGVKEVVVKSGSI